MHRTNKRLEHAALVGLGLQIVFFGLFFILFSMSMSPAVLSEVWHLFAGAGLWLLIYVELYQQRMARQQRGELEDLERQRTQKLGGSESAFRAFTIDEELPAEKRLKFIKRYFVPIFSIVIALVLLLLSVMLLGTFKPLAMTMMSDAMAATIRSPYSTLAICALVSLVCFIMSRYCLGLSKTHEGRILRAGANYIIGNALVCFALVVVLALSVYGINTPMRILAKVIPVMMIALAAEIVLNLILDIYRPRVRGEEYRPSYESRLLGLFSEPEGVLHSISQTIDYQFGFKVSETWFYQLLGQAVAPLVLFGIVTLYLMSIFIVVQPGHQAIVTHYGKKPATVLKEGSHWKWPWPIDKATVYNVGQMNQMIIGFSGESSWIDKTKTDPILWTVKHVTGSEFQLLVSSKKMSSKSSTEKDQAEISPVNILAGDLVIYYNIKDEQQGGLLDYVSNYENPEMILESVAYRQWTQYMASVDPMTVMTTERQHATDQLAKSIQEEIDKRHSGLKVVQVAMIGMHPPVEIASAFESAINTRQERETMILRAKGEASERVPTAKAVESETLLAAQGNQYGKLTVEKAKADRFIAQLETYKIAPDVFFLRNYLDVFVQSTANVRKYILAIEHPEKAKIIVDDKEKISAGIMGMGEGIEEEVKKETQDSNVL